MSGDAAASETPAGPWPKRSTGSRPWRPRSSAPPAARSVPPSRRSSSPPCGRPPSTTQPATVLRRGVLVDELESTGFTSSAPSRPDRAGRPSGSSGPIRRRRRTATATDRAAARRRAHAEEAEGGKEELEAVEAARRELRRCDAEAEMTATRARRRAERAEAAAKRAAEAQREAEEARAAAEDAAGEAEPPPPPPRRPTPWPLPKPPSRLDHWALPTLATARPLFRTDPAQPMPPWSPVPKRDRSALWAPRRASTATDRDRTGVRRSGARSSSSAAKPGTYADADGRLWRRRAEPPSQYQRPKTVTPGRPSMTQGPAGAPDRGSDVDAAPTVPGGGSARRGRHQSHSPSGSSARGNDGLSASARFSWEAGGRWRGFPPEVGNRPSAPNVCLKISWSLSPPPPAGSTPVVHSTPGGSVPPPSRLGARGRTRRRFECSSAAQANLGTPFSPRCMTSGPCRRCSSSRLPPAQPRSR